jgi:hypothetical protein
MMQQMFQKKGGDGTYISRIVISAQNARIKEIPGKWQRFCMGAFRLSPFFPVPGVRSVSGAAGLNKYGMI